MVGLLLFLPNFFFFFLSDFSVTIDENHSVGACISREENGRTYGAWREWTREPFKMAHVMFYWAPSRPMEPHLALRAERGLRLRPPIVHD